MQSHANEWLPVTSDDTLDALRELRKQGHDIKQRVTGGQREAMLVVPEAQPDATPDTQEVHTPERFVATYDVVKAAAGEDPWGKQVDHSPASVCQHTNKVTTTQHIACKDCGEILEDIPEALTPGMAGRTNALRQTIDPETGKTTWEVATETCPECGEQYVVRDEHILKSDRHRLWAKGELGPEFRTPQQQPTYKFPVDWPRKRIEFGLVITCPRCHGYRRPAKTRISRAAKTFGQEVTTPADEVCMDPTNKNERCMRCNGWGIIPNAGPVESDKELSHGKP